MMDKAYLIAGLGIGGSIAVAWVNHALSKSRTISDSNQKAKEKALPEIQKALASYLDWFKESLPLIEGTRNLTHGDRIIKDPAPSIWIERFREQKEILPGFMGVTEKLNVRQCDLMVLITGYYAYPEPDEADRRVIKEYFISDGRIRRRAIIPILKDLEALIQHLKLLVQYECNKQISKAPAPDFSKLFGEFLSMDKSGNVIFDNYENYSKKNDPFLFRLVRRFR